MSTEASSFPKKVTGKSLLWVMGTGPLMGALALFDGYALNGTLKQAMDLPLSQILTITALLTFPHIVASLIGFADREYLAFYMKPILKGLVVSIGISIACWLFMDGPTILFIVAFYSVYHNVMQQFGISAMLLKMKQTGIYILMKWLYVIPMFLTFAVITLTFVPDIDALRGPMTDIIHITLAAATILAAFIAKKLLAKPDLDRTGFHYLAANLVAIYVGYALFMAGYGLMAVILSRVIHDATAYWIYMAHDENRNSIEARNPLYRLAGKLGLRPFYALIPLAVIISAIVMGIYEKVDAMALVISAANLFHYYIEGHTWKRGTPHRKYVPFV